MSVEEEVQRPSLGRSSIREDLPLSRAELGSTDEPQKSSFLQTGAELRQEDTLNENEKTPFLKALIDAETAASAAAVQLASFNDAMENEMVLGKSSKAQSQVTRQRGLLLGKLKEFRRLNKSVRQKLKQLQDAEISKIAADKQITALQRRISQAESENEHLKQNLNEMEKKIEKILDFRKEEQSNIENSVCVAKHAEETRARLQGLLRNKESEKNRLTIQLQSMERTVKQQKLEIDELKAVIASVNKKAAQDTESLKKATRGHKLRAERFEAAIEKCYAQLKEKDAQLAKAYSEREPRRRQKEQMTDEKETLLTNIDLLKSQVADLTSMLQKERNELTAANETVVKRVTQLIAENGDLTLSNEALKASVARLEQQLADCESALVEEKIVSEDRKHQVEQFKNQVGELRNDIGDLSLKYTRLLEETERTRVGKDSEVKTVRLELQGRVDESSAYPALLSAAEQRLDERQKRLQSLEQECSEKTECVKQLQCKMESQSKHLGSSLEMRDSIQEANLQLEEKVISLKKKIETLQQENLELVRKLGAQGEALSYSNRQLDQRSSECQALSRQLEAALSEVRQQVSLVKTQAASREDALQTKVLELEAAVMRKDKELRLLHQSKQTAEKQFEVRLKDLQLSLSEAESHKQSIQNYVDFLKNSYKTMFDEGLQTTTFGSSNFLN